MSFPNCMHAKVAQKRPWQNAKAENQRLVEKASALVSLYGDEATTPCLQYA